MNTAAVEGQPVESETPLGTNCPDEDKFNSAGQNRPIHLAKCRECAAAVKFQPTASGTGFTLVDPDPEARFGAGSTGLPMCPNGHGEMMIADEAIPVADAISQVAEKVNGTPQQASLPGTVPPFNFEGAYFEIEAKAVEVDALRSVENEHHETFKESKKAREKAEEVLGKMILEFRRRRREKDAGGPEAQPPTVERCRFEQLNPGVPCPLCTDATWDRSTAPASEEHGVAAKDVLEGRELAQCVERLKLVPIYGISVEYLRSLPMDQRSSIEAWAGDVEDHPDERDRWMEDGLPPGLEGAHKASDASGDGQQQNCTECGLLIGFEGEEPYPAGAFVGTGCKGKERQRYPKRGTKKPQAKRGKK